MKMQVYFSAALSYSPAEYNFIFSEELYIMFII
jgi:hypothetical protein